MVKAFHCWHTQDVSGARDPWRGIPKTQLLSSSPFYRWEGKVRGQGTLLKNTISREEFGFKHKQCGSRTSTTTNHYYIECELEQRNWRNQNNCRTENKRITWSNNNSEDNVGMWWMHWRKQKNLKQWRWWKKISQRKRITHTTNMHNYYYLTRKIDWMEKNIQRFYGKNHSWNEGWILHINAAQSKQKKK